MIETKERKNSTISNEYSDTTSNEEDNSSSNSSLTEEIKEIFSDTDLPDNKIGFEELDELREEEKKEISNDYIFKVMSRGQLHNIFKSKIDQCSNYFEYAKLDLSIFAEALQMNKYSVNEAQRKVQFDIIGYLGNRVLRNEPEDKDFEGYCNVCFLEVSDEDSVDFGCKHILCSECMNEYLRFKVDQGPDALRTTCPFDGCKFGLTSDIVLKVCKKSTYKK